MSSGPRRRSSPPRAARSASARNSAVSVHILKHLHRRCASFDYAQRWTVNGTSHSSLSASGEAAHAFSGLQERPGFAVEHEAGELAAGEGAGVDADAVALDLGRLGDVVAMDDDLAEIDARAEKLVADPQHVLQRLGVERHARLDPGMDEIEVALDMAERQLAQEGEATRRH